ncbi:MAG: LysM peptidoglycan-binding domain-containing protein [Marinilabiliaceae bacterium]|nr:LysM peptidoglycan-binding domain-containing protein [Marinilabiliaceae bacterium]
MIKINNKDFYLHKVSKGEGLFRIAKNYNVSQNEIINANPGLLEQGMQIGQVINIPVIDDRNKTNEINEANKGFIYHTVEQGQTAFFISKKYNVSLDVFYYHNPDCKLSMPIGKVVKIPYEELNSSQHSNYIIHTIAPNETLYSISKKYLITPDVIIKENPGVANGIVKIGSQIRIPEVSPVSEKNEDEKVVGVDLYDKTFLYHVVTENETLYSIASKYNVSVGEIENSNPGLEQNNLPIGYVIRVPRFKPLKNQSLLESSFLQKHKVAKKETLFGISKHYNTEIDIIKKLNPNVDFSNLRKGIVLKVPTQKWIDQYYLSQVKPIEDKKDSLTEISIVDCETYKYDKNKEVIKVAVLLPFANGTKKTEEDLDVKSDILISGRAKVVLEFYEGFLMGINELKEKGINIDLKVYNTGNNGNDITRIIKLPELKEVDIIVGPAHSDQIKKVSDFAFENQIKIINPFTTNNSELTVNPYMFQLTTPDTLLIDKISETVLKLGAKKRVLVLKTKNVNDRYETLLTSQIKSKLFWNSFNRNDNPDMVDVEPESWKIERIESLLVKDYENLIVIPSNDEVIVNKAINLLNALYEKGITNFTLVGLPSWLKFYTIDSEYIHRMNGHVISYYGVEYGLPKTNSFLTKYRSLFYTEPMAFNPHFQKTTSSSGYSRFGIFGYDVATYFVGARATYGDNFESCIFDYKPSLIQSNFHFTRITNWGGFYNDGLMILHFTPDFDVKCIKL